MKKGLFIFLCICAALYWALHLALGSSPVQQRVVEEITKALEKYGFNLKIESIEFSAFSPKVYLNKVTISSNPNAEINLEVPLTVDKLKIEFSPFGLLYRKIVIKEAALYNPKLILPRADRLYRKVETLLKDQKQIEMEGGSFTLVIQKIGVIDALFNVVSVDPPFAVRSRSLTSFLVNDVQNQKNVSLKTVDLEIDRKKLSAVLNNVDVDVDVSTTSLRLNQALIEGEELFLDMKGTMSLPKKTGALPDNINVSYQMSVPLAILNDIPELGAPVLEGTVASSGTVKLVNRNYTGAGRVKYNQVSVDGYQIESGETAFSLANRNVNLSAVNLKWAGGELLSDDVQFVLGEPVTVAGNLRANGLQLTGILANVNATPAPVTLRVDTNIDLSGQFTGPFRLATKLLGDLSDFTVYDEEGGKRDDIVAFKQGKIDGTLTFFEDRMDFSAIVGALAGKAQTEGSLSFDNKARIRVRAEGLSLTELSHIANLQVGGKTDLVADIDVVGKSAKVSGSLDVTDAEIADLYFGNLKGLAHYENELLSFEDLSLKTSLDSVQGSGFVDFREGSHYKFRVRSQRIAMDEVFNMFRGTPLSFEPPKGGEVAAMVNFEGGKKNSGIELKASGEARNFNWYGEKWSSSKFDIEYRPDDFMLNKVVLFKKSGALDITARFKENQATLNLSSRGLRVEELDWVGGAPLAGQLIGGVRLEGEFPYPIGGGNIRLAEASFRGEKIPDSILEMQTSEGAVEVKANFLGDKLQGIWSRNLKNKENWKLGLEFKKFDFTPLITMAMGKDIGTFSDVTATGDIALTGRLRDWKAMKGGGTISHLDVGLKGTPMINRRPLEIKVDNGTVRVNQFNLEGRDGQLLVGLVYQPEERVQASLDGKIDLQFLQPFIPGLDAGSGMVSMGIRISGKPPHFDLLGNAVLEDGAFRLSGLNDEFRSAQIQLSLSQNRIDFDKFTAKVNGGSLNIQGDVRIGKEKNLIPNLTLNTNRVRMSLYQALSTQFTGDFTIRGSAAPYALNGNCALSEARLTNLEMKASPAPVSAPLFKFDIRCAAPRNLLVMTDTIAADFRGNFHIVGDSHRTGLLGTVDMINGKLFFRKTEFALRTGQVRFESRDKIAPRFDFAGATIVKEKKTDSPQEYEVNIKAVGVPEDYKILLSSTPALAESAIISLLVLGVTERTQDGNYVELGTALVGQVPIQSKLEEQLGVEINVAPQTDDASAVRVTSPQDPATDVTVPMVEIQKQIGDKTTLSYSNSIAGSPVRRVKVEHELGDHVTVNGSFVDKAQGTTDTQTVQSYGLDFRYRFKFE